MARVRLPVHEEQANEGLQALRAEALTRPYTIRVSRSKLAILVVVTWYCSSGIPMSGKTLEKLIGSWSRVLLFSRMGLAILNEAYHETRAHPADVIRPISAEVRSELRVLCALAPWFGTNMESPWCMRAYMTD